VKGASLDLGKHIWNSIDQQSIDIYVNARGMSGVIGQIDWIAG